MKSTTLSTACILALSACALQAQPVGFPARAADLGDNQFWVVSEFGEGPNVLDLHVERRYTNGWTRCKNGTSCSTNEGHATFGTPIYAPVDGVVRTCWRNFDDNPSPGTIDPRVVSEGNPNPKIFRGGNHINIETLDGRVVFIGHMKKGSLPSALCPNNAAEANPDDRTGSYPTQSIIPAAQRANYAVKRGQLIGQAGNSGTSTAPHMHMHMKTKTGDDTDGTEGGLPMPYMQAWAQDYHSNAAPSIASWYKLNGVTVTSASGPTMISPSPFLRRDTEVGDPVHSAEPVFLSTGRAVTAVRNNLGNLSLISWALPFDGTLVRRSEVVEGAATNVKVVAPTANHVVAGVKDASGNLKLILYSVDANGNFDRLDDVVSEAAYNFDMAVTSGGNETKVVVAMRRQSDDKLKILVWDVVLSGGPPRLQAAGSRVESGIYSAAITGTRNFFGVAVAVRTAEQTLKVIPYRLYANSNSIVRGTDYEAGEVNGAIDITSIPKGVAAAMRDSANNLRVISLETSVLGNISGSKEAVAWSSGEITEVKIASTPNASKGNVATVVRDNDGELRIIGWMMNDDGSNLRRSGSTKVGAATNVSAAGGGMTVLGSGSPRDVLLTTMRDSDGNLRVIEWEANLNP